MSDEPLYDFTVVIPTYNRPAQLAVCLTSFAALDYPRDRFEVIVVDDGSREPLDAVVAPYTGSFPLTLFRTRQGGPGGARNLGAHRARGRYLAFTDDDCTAAADWLKALHAFFEKHPRALAGGKVVNALTRNLYSAACHTIIDAAYSFFDPAQGRAHFFPSNNFAMLREEFLATGGFDPNWRFAGGEDRMFCYHWLRRGGAMVCAPDAVIYHHHALSLASYCELHYRYGRGARRYHSLQLEPQQDGGLKPTLDFYRTCFLLPFAQGSRTRALAISSLLVLWQFANAAGYFRERLRV